MQVERGRAADMQPRETSLEERDVRVQGWQVDGTAISAACQPLQPARPDVMDGEIRRYLEIRELPGSQRRSGREAGVESL
jgi:hypothetical protein